MYQIVGNIEGIAPILFSRFHNPESLDGAGGGRLSKDERLAEVALRVHRDADGGIVVPAWNFKRCLVEGVRKAGLKEGRASMAPFVEATVFPAHDLVFGKTEPDFVLEVPGRRPPKTGGAVIVRYPAFNTGWSLDFTLNIVDDRRDANALKRALDEAGLLVGMGSWRPEYGRFIVRSCDIIRANSSSQ